MLPIIRQRSTIRLAILLGTLAWVPSSFATESTPTPALKKKAVHAAPATGVRHPVTARTAGKPPVRARAGLKTPVKTAAVPHVVARAGVKHTSAAAQVANQAIAARASAGSKGSSRGVWRVPNYADSLEGDNVDGEDLLVRRAAVDALGPLNGSIVVTDANTGRVLTIVNQKLAFKSGYQPCSTVKVPVALAALSENVVDRETPFTSPSAKPSP